MTYIKGVPILSLASTMTRIQDAIQYVQTCDMCQQIKSGHQFPQGLLQPFPVPEQIWEDVSLDFVEGLPKSNDKDCVMVVIHRSSKVGHFIVLSHPFTATQVAQLFLDNIYKLHGMPKSMVWDRDKLFTSNFGKESFNSMGTQLHISTSYHPQTNKPMGKQGGLTGTKNNI